ncbi:MAG TPA: type IX secretion system membrane protein PorP/SprF [Flavobacteriales bacterium]|nr:type IX secretion system membrane protein PorP/SprF [Flavobacteriales bacterium]HRW88334.1 type IX secretion system membrane protein PorP/SprF [Flavobacteriales bacterium]
MRTARHIALCSALLLAGVMSAQDAHFTQFYATPTYLNPAFAGTTLQTRFGAIYRDQWPSIPGSFVTYNFAFDHYLSDLNSGVGLIMMHDRAGSGALRYTSVTGQYAYEIELKRKVFIRPALQIGWVSHAVDYSRLVFGDQLVRGGDVATYENLDGRSVNYTNMGTGVLFFTPRMWLGMALDHLNEPNQSLLSGESRLPRKFSMHGGYRFNIRTAVIKDHPQSVVAAFNYRAQEKYDQLDLGAYYEREPFFAGLWYRGLPLLKAYQPGYQNNDAIAILAGVMVNDLRIGYSYDLTISRLAGYTAGSHEVSLVYELADRRKKKAMSKRRVVPCAKF